MTTKMDTIKAYVLVIVSVIVIVIRSVRRQKPNDMSITLDQLPSALLYWGTAVKVVEYGYYKQPQGGGPAFEEYIGMVARWEGSTTDLDMTTRLIMEGERVIDAARQLIRLFGGEQAVAQAESRVRFNIESEMKEKAAARSRRWISVAQWAVEMRYV